MRALGRLLIAALIAACAALAGPASALFGGVQANPEAWKSAVALVHAGQDAVTGQFCGGTLVRADWVVTAAHCVYEPGPGATAPGAIEVIAGTSVLGQVAPSQRYGVDRVAIYPYYFMGNRGQGTTSFDVALLHLTRPVDGAQPALIGARAYASGGTQPATAWVAGWGLSAEGQTQATEQLLTGEVSVSSRSVCERVSRKIAVICATFPESLEASACYGDSGGPLMSFRYSVPEVIGIVSTGPGYCGQGVTTVYTDVGTYKPWIAHVSRVGDPLVSLPTITRVRARDIGGAIRAQVNWCQNRGKGQPVRVDFTLFQGSVENQRNWKTFSMTGRASADCMWARKDIPDTFANGRWQVIAKVIDRRTKMTGETDYPARVRITG